MDNDLFRKGEWLGTFTILFIFAMATFLVACLLGFFVDPDLTIETRRVIVGAWTGVFGMTAFLTTMARHA